jgi:hypothetical protein
MGNINKKFLKTEFVPRENSLLKTYQLKAYSYVAVTKAVCQLNDNFFRDNEFFNNPVTG